MITFKKSGFYTTTDGVTEKLDADLGFVTHLRDEFTLDADDKPTLNDFVTWLKAMGEDLLFIEMYTGCQVSNYLKVLGPQTPDEEPLSSIDVAAFIDVSDYDGKQPGDFILGKYFHCSGLTPEGEHQAIEFVAWEKMLGVPFTVDPTVKVTTSTWTVGDGTKPGIVDGKWNSGGRKPTVTTVSYRMQSITFGDWLQSVLGELCWFSDPAKRDQEFETLVDLVKSIKDDPLVAADAVPARTTDIDDLRFEDLGDSSDDEFKS